MEDLATCDGSYAVFSAAAPRPRLPSRPPPAAPSAAPSAAVPARPPRGGGPMQLSGALAEAPLTFTECVTNRGVTAIDCAR
jgi:hypothetical protein